MTQHNTDQAARQQLAASFIARGFSVLVLHDVSAGHCSCGDARCLDKPRNQGKHPRMGGAWQTAGLTTVEQAADWIDRYPLCNLGILTGPASGVWVLDVDPVHGGDVALAELEREHGPLPYTYTVRTGSGGSHLYFLLPEDFTPTNGNRLPAGLDTRGAGGQVVAPGSRTLLGDYWISVDAPVAEAPGWLLDLIRPRAAAEPAEFSSTVNLLNSTRELATAAGPLPDYETARLSAYAGSAVMAELHQLADATPGGRGFTAYKVACNLIELLNSPWARLDFTQVWQLYMAAAHRAMAHGGAFDAHEAVKSWESASKHIGTQSRPAPPPPPLGGVVALPAAAGSAPFDTGSAAETGIPGYPSSGSMAGMVSLGPIPAPRAGEPGAEQAMLTGGSSGSPLGSFAPVDGVDPLLAFEVGKQLQRMRAQRAAREVLDAEDRAAAAGSLEQRVAALRAAMLDRAALSTIPKLKPLVDGWLMRNTLARVYGPSGHGKSFVMIDLAACVGTGVDWHGHAVSQGEVWYMVAEGAEGIDARVSAWEAAHGVPLAGVRFLPMPVQVGSPEWEALEHMAAADRPAMIVGDTQARITVGVDENSAREMGEVVAHLERLRERSGACVLLVHHSGVNGEHARGSSSIRAAMQTELAVSKAGSVVTVRTVKQKDHEQLPDFELVLKPMPSTGSVALVRELNPAARLEESDLSLAGLMAEVGREVFHEGTGGTKSEILAATAERRRFSRSQGNKAWNKVIAMGVFGKIRGTASWIYIPVEDRSKMIEPTGALGQIGAKYAPGDVSAGEGS